MKKLLYAITLAFTIIACNKTSNDYVTLSGTITNKNSDSIVVVSRSYSKTIKVNADGTFKDTLKVETGVYNLYDGTESTNIFLKNGFDIQVAINTEKFDETVTFTGHGAEHSNFLAKNNLLQEQLLNVDVLSNLDAAGVDAKFNDIKKQLTEFYIANKNIDTSITNTLSRNLDPMLNYFKGYLEESLTLKNELAKGSPSPTFENYENYKGGTTSLSDLKGNYVYIDVWATWCGPCKAQIPALKELDKTYEGKNIKFVSISVDDDRSHGGSWDSAHQNWKAMVADKQLTGIQLMAPQGWQSQFVLDYKITGIPRFILIDPNGNIITPDAPRPSDASLTDLFTSLGI